MSIVSRQLVVNSGPTGKIVNMPKVFHCSKCNGQHKRPVGSKCQILEQSTSSTSVTGTDQTRDESAQILSALNAVTCRLSAIEQRIDRTEEQLQVQSAVSTSSLLAKINEQGKFRSQRANNDQITVKQQVPWPQNYVLAGTSKSRVTYDSLSTFQWMAGVCAIIREEKTTKVKNAMLDYLSELMEDAQDFGWASAKGAHALILCRMEEGKVNWLNADKLDRLRRAHAQKVVNNNSSTGQGSKSKNESQGVLCKYFQSGKCSHKTEHTTNGQLYKHLCSHCHSLGKKF